MSGSDYITNITTTYTDDNGNYLIGSDNILSVYYYNSSVSVDGSWKTDWAVANPVSEPYFSNPVLVSGVWSFETDSAGSPTTSVLGLSASWYSTDLLENKTVTSSGYNWPYTHDDLVDFDSNTGWETPDASGGGTYAATIDIGSVEEFNYVLLSPGFGDSTTTDRMIKDYRIGVSVTGNENDFTIVAAGTTVSGNFNPIPVSIGSVSARYVKIYVDSNWGSSAYTRVFRLSAYNNPNWSLFGYHVNGNTGGSYYRAEQQIDLTDVDTLFIDARAYMSKTYGVGELSVTVSGVGGSTDDVIKNYNWANTGTAWLDSLDGNTWTRYEEELDVSSYTGDAVIKLNIFNDNYGVVSFYGFFDNVRSLPLWYGEGISTKRGSDKQFPDEVYILSDSKGLSIINKRDLSLWMRFDVGFGYMLGAPVRHVSAKSGRLYCSTSKGLYIIDFVSNRCWLFDDTGVYYRMSIGRRNQYAFWFTDTTSVYLPSRDVMWCDIINSGGTDLLTVAHSNGITTIETWLSASRTFRNSSFSYPVHSVHYMPSSGVADKIAFVGQDDTESFVGVVNSPSVLSSAGFDGVTFLETDVGLSDTHTGFTDSWHHVSSDLYTYFDDTTITISGAKQDYGKDYFIHKYRLHNKPFSASVNVQIRDWPSLGEGGFYFGVASGWPSALNRNGVTPKSISMAAVNGIEGVYVENESFSNYPAGDNWTLTVDNNGTRVYNEDDYVFMGVEIGAVAGDGYAPATMFGHRRTLSTSFSVKIKVKCTFLTKSSAYDRQSCVLFGVTDGQYIPYNGGTNALYISLYSDATEADPPVYCLASSTAVDSISWDTSTALPLFSNDTTSSAAWHQWELSYDSATKTITAAIDGNSLGSKSLAGLDSNVGIVFGAAGNEVGTIDVQFKDFEIDFGDIPDYAKEKYIVQTEIDGSIQRPTISGVHLDGIDFYPTDGTSSASWRTWRIDYTPPVLHAYIDSVPVGSSVLSFDSNAPIQLYIGCDHVATDSGTASDRWLDINVSGLSVDYDPDFIVVSGIANNVYVNSGSYLGSQYNSVYVATTGGVQEVSYAAAATISGSPDLYTTYATNTSSGTNNILYGNIDNVVTVEAEDGYVGNNGLLYVGTSSDRLSQRWEHLVDRPGGTGISNTGLSLGVLSLYSKLYVYYFDGVSPYLYERSLVDGRPYWNIVGIGDYPSGFSDSPSVLQHKARIIDLLDGNLYYFDDPIAAIRSCSGEWLMEGDNIQAGAASPSYTQQAVCPAVSRREAWLVDGNTIMVFLTDNYDWSSYLMNNTIVSWSTGDTACTYSDIDNSLYVLEVSSSAFYRISLDSHSVYEQLDSCPQTAGVSSSVSMFYRPYDHTIYVFMGIGSSAYIVKYDVVAGEWHGYSDPLPSTVYTFADVSYDPVNDVAYVVTGLDDLSLYKYTFSLDPERLVLWDVDNGVKPENMNDKYIYRALDSYGLDDTFLSTSLRGDWVNYIVNSSSASITPTSSGLSIELPYTGSSTVKCAVVSSCLPVPLSDFTLEADVRIKGMCSSNGTADNRNMVLMGVTGYKGAYAFDSSSYTGMSVSSMGGLFLAAMNDYGVTDNRYTMVAVDGDEYYYNTSSSYMSFSGDDGTPSADFRHWKIEYDHSTYTASFYVDSSFIGSTSLSGVSLDSGALISFGAWSYNNAVSGTTSFDVRSLTITPTSSSSITSGYLDLNAASYYDYCFYDKYDALLASGTGFEYEASANFVGAATINNDYVCTIGEVRDGHKRCLLAALKTTPSSIGLYTGGDPTDYASYDRYDIDWSVRHSYVVKHEGGKVRVFVDGSEAPVIEDEYTALPGDVERKVLFGNYNIDKPVYIETSSRNGSVVQTSGTWTKDYDSLNGCYYGVGIYSSDSSVDTKVVCSVNSVDDQNVYVFYDIHSTRPTAVPITIYHSGAVSVPDTIVTSNTSVVSVDYIDEYGNSTSSATTVYVDQTRYSDGRPQSDIVESRFNSPSGWLYLGTYTNIDRIVVTTSGTSTSSVAPGLFKLTYSTDKPKSKGSFRFYDVKYSTCSGISINTDKQAGFSVVERNGPVLLDYYSSSTSPSIVADDIENMDVVQ